MLEIIGLACIGVLFICSEPTIRLRNWILGKHQGIWRRLLECAMCSTFYIAILYKFIWFQEFDLLFAATCSVLAEIITQKLNGGL
jgi:hypothetical protein